MSSNSDPQPPSSSAKEIQSSAPHYETKITDVGTAVLWDKGDAKHVSRHIAEILKIKRASWIERDPEKKAAMNAIAGHLADKYQTKVERAANDQTVTWDSDGTKFEPHEVTQKEDLLVITGLIRFAALIAGDSNAYFLWFASGTSNQPESTRDNALFSENMRVSMLDSGYSTSSGVLLRYVGFFPEGTPNASIAEGGVFDQAVGGAIGFRTVYTNALQHVQYNTFYTLSQGIQFSSSG